MLEARTSGVFVQAALPHASLAVCDVPTRIKNPDPHYVDPGQLVKECVVLNVTMGKLHEW